MTWQLGALLLGVAASVVPLRRIPHAVAVVFVAIVALATGPPTSLTSLTRRRCSPLRH